MGYCTGKDVEHIAQLDNPCTMDDLRADLFRLIDATPNLDWLLLTKRPENIRPMIERTVGIEWWKEHCADNTWLGTSCSDQATANKAIPELLKCRDLSTVLFASAEPLLASMDFRAIRYGGIKVDSLVGSFQSDVSGPQAGGGRYGSHAKLDLVICGGESGPRARPCDVDWIRSIVRQCKEADVACFVKQLGAFAFDGARHLPLMAPLGLKEIENQLHLRDPKGGDIAEFPWDLQIREMPIIHGNSSRH